MYVQCVWSNMSISNRPLQPPTHASSINLRIIISIIILDYSDHHTRSRWIARERESERERERERGERETETETETERYRERERERERERKREKEREKERER